VEISNPFANIRFVLRHHFHLWLTLENLTAPCTCHCPRLLLSLHPEWRRSIWYKLNGIIFTLLFCLTRVFPLPLYWSVGVNAYPTYRAPQWIRWTFFSLGMSLDALNVYWAIRLVKGAMRQWRER